MKQVVDTIGPNTDLVVEKVTVQTGGVTIDVRGSGTIPSAATFERDLLDELGPDVSVTITRN